MIETTTWLERQKQTLTSSGFIVLLDHCKQWVCVSGEHLEIIKELNDNKCSQLLLYDTTDNVWILLKEGQQPTALHPNQVVTWCTENGLNPLEFLDMKELPPNQTPSTTSPPIPFGRSVKEAEVTPKRSRGRPSLDPEKRQRGMQIYEQYLTQKEKGLISSVNDYCKKYGLTEEQFTQGKNAYYARQSKDKKE